MFFCTVGPEWQLIFGGYVSNYTQTVELFNWKTFQQCQLPDLPFAVQHQVASVLEGTPVFCGGSTNSGSSLLCYKLDKTNDTWVQVSVFLWKYKVSKISFGGLG
jgi:hypothetical protein